MDPELLDVAADRWHRRWLTAVVERGREVASAPPRDPQRPARFRASDDPLYGSSRTNVYQSERWELRAGQVARHVNRIPSAGEMTMQGWPFAIVFPGQGALDVRTVEAYQQTAPRLFESAAGLDRASGARWRIALIEALSGSSAPSGHVALKIYAASIAAFERLTARGAAPHALVGHGFGEIAALVAAGAFTVGEGAEIVAARHLALSSSSRRYALASIQASSSKVALFLELLQDAQVSIAVENSSRHTVIVGPERAIAGAAEMARQLGLVLRKLKTMAAPHGAHMKGAAAQMVDRLRHLSPRALQIPVYSPLRRRYFVDSDDLIGTVAEQLAEPLCFADAVRRLADEVALFVECGPLRGLAGTLDCASIADTEFDRRFAAEREAREVPAFSQAYAESEVA